MARVTVGLIAAIACIAPQVSAAAVRTSVMVRPESEVAAADVKLGDIASLRCADQKSAAKLQAITICSAPLPGKSRRIQRDQVVIAMRRVGIADGSVDLLSPADISITRIANTVTGQSLFEAARQYVLVSVNRTGTVAVEPVRLPADQQVPSGKLELRVKSGYKTADHGRVALPVEILVDGQVCRTVSVSVLIKVLARVLVASEAIRRSTEISATNTTVEERDITYLASDVVIGEPEPGCTALAAVSAGAIVRRSWIAPAPAIHSGDAVLVVVRSGAVRLADKGIAVQDARKGETVKIRFTGDRREVRGTVVEPGVAEIVLGGRSR